MILSIEECKLLLGIDESDKTKDAQIEALIPIVRDQIVDHCRNYFVDKLIYEGGSPAFTPGTGTAKPKIQITGVDWDNTGFRASDSILITGSLVNDGLFTIDSISTDTLTLNARDKLKAETNEQSCFVFKVCFPEPLKITASKMVKFNLDGDGMYPIQSEKIGGYTVQYAVGGEMSYPTTIVAELRRYKLPGYVKVF